MFGWEIFLLDSFALPNLNKPNVEIRIRKAPICQMPMQRYNTVNRESKQTHQQANTSNPNKQTNKQNLQTQNRNRLKI